MGWQASPYLLSLGLTKSNMAIVFVAGPLSGLIMQPLIGALPFIFTFIPPIPCLSNNIFTFLFLLLFFPDVSLSPKHNTPSQASSQTTPLPAGAAAAPTCSVAPSSAYSQCSSSDSHVPSPQSLLAMTMFPYVFSPRPVL